MVDQVLSVRRRGVDAAAIITSGGGVSKDCWLPMTIWASAVCYLVRLRPLWVPSGERQSRSQ